MFVPQSMAVPVHARDLVQLALDMNSAADFTKNHFENGHVIMVLTRKGSGVWVDKAFVVDKSQTSRITKNIGAKVARVDSRITDLSTDLSELTQRTDEIKQGVKQQLELIRAELALNAHPETGV
jgi:methyl-accepting chemotaxis protein